MKPFVPALLALALLLTPPLSAAETHPAAAAAPYPADLPPLDQALAAIRKAPQARAAEAMIDAETANRSRLEAGPHEWAVRLDGQRRRVVTPNAENFQEWSAGIERPLRLPNKAGIDSELGQQGVQHAKTAWGDALHETARDLLRRWFSWLRERETARQWQAQADLLRQQQKATGRRTQLGDAPKLELMLAEAATAQAQAALAQAELKLSVATADINARYPAVSLPAQPVAATPTAIEGGFEAWREHLLEHHHELALARADSQKARLLAARADAERIPDPTIGLHVGRERSGEERIAGLTLTLPLPGEARRAAARRESAMAEAASQREAAAFAKASAEIAAEHAAAQATYTGWQRAEESAQRMRQTAALIARAYQLGEAGLADLLLARRQENEAALAATTARLDALEARYRLLLDTHQLWAYDDETHE